MNNNNNNNVRRRISAPIFVLSSKRLKTAVSSARSVYTPISYVTPLKKSRISSVIAPQQPLAEIFATPGRGLRPNKSTRTRIRNRAVARKTTNAIANPNTLARYS
jgi:hypothetical protein